MSNDFVLLLGAFICFVLATFGLSAKISLQSLGLALWVASILWF